MESSENVQVLSDKPILLSQILLGYQNPPDTAGAAMAILPPRKQWKMRYRFNSFQDRIETFLIIITSGSNRQNVC